MQTVAETYDYNFDFVDREVCFDETEDDHYSAMIPDEQPLRPFYFMRLIQKTIREGGFITENLYVPKAVWY